MHEVASRNARGLVASFERRIVVVGYIACTADGVAKKKEKLTALS